MPRKKTATKKRINTTVTDNKYFILVGSPAKPDKKEVEADDIAFDVIGMRYDTSGLEKRVVLDHIPTGYRIATFKTMHVARQAARELLHVSDFKWLEPPDEVKPAIAGILRRLK